MTAVYAVDACLTPVAKIKGMLASIRPDHLSADVIAALLARNPWLDPARIDDVYWGAANQAGEDNRNVARMAALLAGLPVEIPGATVNRLCGSGMEAIACAARAIVASRSRRVGGRGAGIARGGLFGITAAAGCPGQCVARARRLRAHDGTGATRRPATALWAHTAARAITIADGPGSCDTLCRGWAGQGCVPRPIVGRQCRARSGDARC